jgi:hypothetical protein
MTRPAATMTAASDISTLRVRFLSSRDMFFHREFVRETNCRGEQRFPVVDLSDRD